MIVIFDFVKFIASASTFGLSLQTGRLFDPISTLTYSIPIVIISTYSDLMPFLSQIS